METGVTRELEAYGSILQNLFALEEEARETEPEEVEAIGVILDNLLAQYNYVCNRDLYPASLPPSLNLSVCCPYLSGCCS